MGFKGSAILFLVVCLAFHGQCKGPRVPWWQIKVAKSQGPNACIVEEVPEINKKYWTECKFWPVRRVCGRDTIVRYECCEGYQRIAGEEGCTGVKPLRNVVETARELGATKFVKYLEDSGIAAELSREGTYTLFAPFDSAFEGSSGAIVSMKILSFMSQGDNPVLRYHISEKKLPSKDFTGNIELESMYENRNLRISKYSTGMETVNCVLISRKDQEASNGIVHMIDRPLDPTVFMPRDVAQVVVEDGRFARLSGAMQRCNFMTRLRDSGKTFTLLAPSDEAFLKITPSRFEKMVADLPSCTALLENHVIPHVMCLPVITEEHKARTIGPARVDFDCDEKGHKIESKRVNGELILGNNGVVYMLDDVLIPDRARTILELLESRHLTTFAQLIRVAGLQDRFSTFGDYTIFAPSEAALYSLDGTLLEEAKRNAELARKLVLYHGTQGRIFSNTIKHNQNMMSLDEENSLRLQVYRRAYGVEDAIIEKSDIEGMNGVIHIINKVIFPAPESAGDILRKTSNYTMFLEAMETVMTADPQAVPLRRGQDTSHYTFFVPSDTAFKSIGASRLRRMQSDTAYLTKIIKNHVSSSMMSSGSFRQNLTYDLPTRQNAVGVSCKNGKMKVNDAAVLKKDIVSANGIIHIIDKLLLPEQDN